jgi:hypothetical protein
MIPYRYVTARRHKTYAGIGEHGCAVQLKTQLCPESLRDCRDCNARPRCATFAIARDLRSRYWAKDNLISAQIVSGDCSFI